MLDIRPLPPKLAAKAAEDFAEEADPELQEKCLVEFRNWVKEQPHLHTRQDDQMLINFLRNCKYNLEKTKKKFDTYYTTRTFLSQYYINRRIDDPRIQHLIKLGIFIPIPYKEDEAGTRVCVVRPAAYDPKDTDMHEITKAITLLADYLIYFDDNLAVSGHTMVFDLNNLKSVLIQLDFGYLRKAAFNFQEAYACRGKALHFINIPFGLEMIVNIIIRIFSKKMRSRVHFHGRDLESLYKHVDKRYLPEEYGGDAGPVDKILDGWMVELVKNKEMLIKEEQYGADETKRPKAKKNNSEAVKFFRRMNVD